MTASVAVPTLERLLAAQRASFAAEGLTTASTRRNRIDRLIALLLDNIDELTAALNDDFGHRPAAASSIYDIAAILPDLNHIRTNLHKWMKTRVPVGLGGVLGVKVHIEARPLGVIGVIGPWNFPVALVAQPAAAAFAAGNRVMIKMSEVTPATADVFARRAAEYFTPAELAVVTGDAAVGSAFAAQPFDHLFFTGSPRVGALVAQSAAVNLVPVTLELGGKNPLVVSPKADLATVARQVLAARLVNGGQVCLCPDYAWVPADDVGTFAAAIGEAYAATAQSGPTEYVEPMSIINDNNFDRIVGLIEDAKRHGANVIHLSRNDRSAYEAATRTIRPTLVFGVNDDMAIAHEEIFGPVLAIHSYRRIEEVLDYVNSRPTPLAAYWHGRQDEAFETFRRGINCGGITVNDFALHCAMYRAPFGGVGRSGYGAYHGKAGFDRFTHYRTVASSRLPINFAEMITPPFSPRLTALTSRTLRWQRNRVSRRLRKAPDRPPYVTG